MKSKTLPFAAFEFDALEVYLENMAKKGCELQELEDERAIFARGAKAAVSYRIDYCAGDAEFDYMLQKYSELGWAHVLTGTGNRLVFRASEAKKEKPKRLGRAETIPMEKSIKAIKFEYILVSSMLAIVTVVNIVIILFFRDSASKGFSWLFAELGALWSWISGRRNYHLYLPQKSKKNDVVVYSMAIILSLLSVIGIVFSLID